MASPALAVSLDDLKGEIEKEYKKSMPGKRKGHSKSRIAEGLKEALRVGTQKAVKKVSGKDGYLKNPKIKIPMPGKMKKLARTLKKVGLKKEVDKFQLSMNRAAERAAPQAVDIFVGAIKEMTFKDAVKILDGGDTAATEYFKGKTRKKLYSAFRPPVSSAMDSVGVTKHYKKLVDKYSDIPFTEKIAVDLDDFVTNKALDGLFHMVGEEEKKIRKNPADRVTKLLKEIFAD